MIVISRFSNKCDLKDTIDIFGAENIIANYKIYICSHILPLEVNKQEDLIPYFPYLVTLMVSSQELGGEIRLSAKSYVDEEEDEMLSYYLDEVIKYYKKCKRKKQPFDQEAALLKISHFDEKDYLKEIVSRVAAKGEKATIEDIHIPFYDRMRRELFIEMLRNGWSESKSYRWCFGLTRWAKWIKENNKLT